MKKVFLTGLTFLAVLAVAGCSADNKKTDSSSSSAAASTESTGTTESSAASNADVKIADGKAASDTKVPGEGTIVMRQMYAAPHGDKSFAAVNVTMNGDKIITARIDEFQYVEGDDWTGVPNSDGGFGENYPKGTVLVGKEENDKGYSALMKDKGGATQTWQTSMTAITDFAKGKTVADLEKAVKELDGQGEKDSPADVVTGATFSDTKGYLQAIIDTANEGIVSEGEKSDTTDLKEAQLLSAPHGDKSFAISTVAMDGDKIAAVLVDEFQYVDPATFGGVPNSNAAFGEGIKDGQVLASKIANDEAYSALMKDKGGATQPWHTSIQAIEKFAVGKTVADLEKAVKDLDGQGEKDSPADVVTGATFSDTKGYLQSIIDTAKKAAE